METIQEPFQVVMTKRTERVEGHYAKIRSRRAQWAPLLPKFMELVNKEGLPVKVAGRRLGVPANVVRDWACCHMQAKKIDIPDGLLAILKDIRLLPRKYQQEITDMWNRGERGSEVLTDAYRRAWKGEWCS